MCRRPAAEATRRTGQVNLGRVVNVNGRCYAALRLRLRACLSASVVDDKTYAALPSSHARNISPILLPTRRDAPHNDAANSAIPKSPRAQAIACPSPGRSLSDQIAFVSG